MTGNQSLSAAYDELWDKADKNATSPKVDIKVEPRNKTWESGEQVPFKLVLEYPGGNDIDISKSDQWYTFWFFFEDHANAAQASNAATKSNLKKQIRAGSSTGQGLRSQLTDVLPKLGFSFDMRAKGDYNDNLPPDAHTPTKLEDGHVSYLDHDRVWHADDLDRNWQQTEFATLVQAFLLSFPADSDGARKSGPAELRLGSDIKMVQVENPNHSSNNEPTSYTFPVDKNGVKRVARRKHSKFIESQKKHLAFTHAVETKDGIESEAEGVRRQKKKVALWTIVSKVLDGIDDPNGRHETNEWLGLYKTAYDDDYFDWYLKPHQQSFIEKMDTPEVSPKASIAEILGFGGSEDWNSPLREKLGETQDRISDDAPEFVTFGRKLYAARTDLERSTQELLTYMKGRSTGWEGIPMFKDNEFMFGLKQLKYDEQLTLLADVLSGLNQTETGKRFLGDLFRYRDRPGMIDPVNIFNPKQIESGEEKNWTKPGGIITVDENRYGEYFDSFGRLKVYGDASEPARAVARAQEKLAKPLASGLATYIKMAKEDLSDVSQFEAEAVAKEYHTKYLGSMLTWQDLKDLGYSDKAKFEAFINDRNPSQQDQPGPDIWRIVKTTNKRMKTVADAAVKTGTASSWGSEFEEPAELKAISRGLVYHHMVMTGVATSNAVSDNQITATEFTKLSIAYAKGFMDGMDLLSTKYDVEFAKRLQRELGEDLLKWVGLGLDLASAGVDMVNNVNLYAERGDTDAAVLGGTAAVADVGVALLTLGSLSGGTAAVAIGIGIAISATLKYLKSIFKDPKIASTIGMTSFGSYLPDTDGTPNSDGFRYTIDGNANYSRQIAAISTDLQNVAVESVSINMRSKNGTQLPHLQVQVGFDSDADVSGELYLRPWFYVDDVAWSHAIAHKIDIDDHDENRTAGNSDWGSECPYLPTLKRQYKNPRQSQWNNQNKQQMLEDHRSNLQSYYVKLADELPGLASGSDHSRPYLDISSVDGALKSNLKPNYDNRIHDASELERVKHVDVSVSSNNLVTVDIWTPYTPALLKCHLVEEVDQRVRNSSSIVAGFGDAEGYLEVIYVPKEQEGESFDETLPDSYPIEDADVRRMLSVPGVAYDIARIMEPLPKSLTDHQ